MKKFKYYVVTEKKLQDNFKEYYPWYQNDTRENFFYSLNKFGENGWELVSVTESYESGTTYYFKKEL